MKTKELTDDQVNLICAAFMDTSYRVEFKTNTNQYVTDNWCNSLDGLIPVSEKYCMIKWGDTSLLGKFMSDMLTIAWSLAYMHGYEIKKGTAHAAALAILEIKPELKELL